MAEKLWEGLIIGSPCVLIFWLSWHRYVNVNTPTHTNTQTLSLSLSLSHTNTRTYTHTLILSFSPSLSHTHSLSFSRTSSTGNIPWTHTRTHTHTHAHTFTIICWSVANSLKSKKILNVDKIACQSYLITFALDLHTSCHTCPLARVRP